jgi:hypothetical protein
MPNDNCYPEESAWGIWVMLCVTGIVILITYTWAVDFVRPTKEAETITELREIIAECDKINRGYPHIQTVFNAPVGQPRKPIKWIVTCKRMKK